MNVIFAGFLGGWEWVVVLGAVLLLFGAKRIPELAKGLGSGIREFKKAAREVTDEVNNAADSQPVQPQPPQNTAPQNPQPPTKVV
ncbi:MAG: twin-arginine translocase TatA/TatE family subunit [Verrucomicrobiota bacterium]|jgi:sec-independent protein translocase protein TatA